MDLKNLRDWLFEVIAILLPGSIAFAIVIIFIFDPTGFIIRIVDFQQIEGVLLPFESQAVNIIFFFSISFILGHFIQQITNPLLNFYIKILGIKRRYMTNIVFESKEIQKFLLPKEVEFNGSLNSFDYYLMVYTDVAPKTNRNTYISISDFCGGIVSLLTIATIFFEFSVIYSLIFNFYLSATNSIIITFVFIFSIIIFVKRSVSFRELADDIFVNHFLSEYGSYVRDKKKD